MHIKNQNPHQKNLRKGRYSSDNQIYHITTTTLSRSPIFKDFSTARLMMHILKKSDELNKTSTLALVIMPDHIHWLFQLNQKQSLSKLIQGIKSISAHAYGKPIWQAGYYDHAIRKDEDIVSVARYIIANPIRAGLVKRVGDYPHWDALWL
jgi:putative transposase